VTDRLLAAPSRQRRDPHRSSPAAPRVRTASVPRPISARSGRSRPDPQPRNRRLHHPLDPGHHPLDPGTDVANPSALSRFRVNATYSLRLIERFLLSLKTEHTRRILVPFGFDAMRREMNSYSIWYNEHRPHQGLGGMTPADRYDGDESDDHARRVDPRPRWPVDEEAVRVKRLDVVVKFVEGRKHLPIVELKRAA